MKHLKYLLAAVIVGSAIFGVAHSQTVSPNLWKTNVPSSTIAPINSNLQVPCANIQGGCSGGVPNSTSTATSSIQNFNGMLSIPYNYATVGCFGSATTTDLGGCVNLAYSLLPSGGGQIDIPSIGVIPYTTPIVEGNQANAKPVMLYCSSGGGFYGGGTILYYTPISGSALTVNNIGYSGGGYGITNCGFNGPAGIGNIGSSTIGSTIGVDLGGTGAQGTAGAFGFTMTGVHISGFGTGLYIGSNMSFMIFQDGTINKNGRDIDSPSVSGANGENMRIVNSTIADCNSPSGQSISAFCMDVQDSGNVQWTLTDDSYDDAQIYSNQFGGTANIWNITDLHDEDPNTGQPCYDRILTQPTAAGAQATVINIKGGDMMEDITTGCPEFVSFGGKLVLDATTGDINNNVSVPDTYYAVPLNNSTVMSWTGLSNQGFNTSNNLNTGFTYVIGTTPGSAIDGLEVGSSSPVYYASTSTFNCSSCGGSGGIASSSPYTSGNLPLINGSGALTNSLISQTVPSATSTIAYDAASAWTTGASVTSTSASITVGSGSNRMLFVFTLTTSGTASTTSVTDNGTGMTLVASTAADAGRTLAMYDLPNPASGASTITINVAASEAVVQLGGVSYSGVLQSATLDATATSATSTGITSLTTSLTTVASNDWSVNLTRFGNGSNGNTAGASSTVRVVSGNGNTSIADTNGGLSPAGTQAMTITNSNGSSGGYSIMAAFAPAPAVTASNVNVAGSITSLASSTPSDIANLDTYQYAASATPAGFSDYDAYLNQLCAVNASGTTIHIPQGTFNVSTTLNITQRCTYIGVGGNGTILQWAGATTSVTMVNENWGTTPHVEGGGLEDLTLKGSNTTTTNPEIGLLQGGGSGGAHGINDGLTIENLGYCYDTASNTYMNVLSNTTIVNCGRNINFATSSNSGESLDYVNVKSLDPANSSSSNCIVANNNALENALWLGGSIDDCQVYVANGNNITFEGVNFENAGYATYGKYDYISEADSFYGTVVNNIGGNMQNDSAASSTSPSEFVNIGGMYYSSGVEVARNTSGAFQVPQYVNNTNNSTDGIATVCYTLNQNNSGNAVGSMFPAGNTTNTTNNGCLSLIQNNYVQGVDYTSGNTNFYTNGGVAQSLINSTKGLTVSGPLSGTGSVAASGASSTVKAGTAANASHGCFELYDSVNSSTLEYIYTSSGTLTATTTKPTFCQ